MGAPTVMPNIATEIATNAKWYHMFTLKTRVSRISNMSVARETRKTPAYWVKGVLSLVVIDAPRRSIRGVRSEFGRRCDAGGSRPPNPRTRNSLTSDAAYGL